MIVEVAAVLPGEAVAQRFAVGGHPDDADHRPGRKANVIVHVDPPVLDAEQSCHGRFDLVDQLPEAGDQAGEAELDRPHVQDLGDERVTRLGALDGDGARGAVHTIEVDLRDEVVLRGDLPGEAVVRLETNDCTGLDLQDGLQVRPEGPDDLVAGDDVVDGRDCHLHRSGRRGRIEVDVVDFGRREDPVRILEHVSFLRCHVGRHDDAQCEQADRALAALRAHPLGEQAAVIGHITADSPGIVLLKTAFGGTRIVDLLVGDPLPRIC